METIPGGISDECFAGNGKRSVIGLGEWPDHHQVGECLRVIRGGSLVHGRDSKDFDLCQLAKATEGLTGSEIEAVFVEALYQAFDEDHEPTDLTIAGILNDFVPLSKTMAEQIAGLRTWAKGRARFATTQVSEQRTRKLAV